MGPPAASLTHKPGFRYWPTHASAHPPQTDTLFIRSLIDSFHSTALNLFHHEGYPPKNSAKFPPKVINPTESQQYGREILKLHQVLELLRLVLLRGTLQQVTIPTPDSPSPSQHTQTHKAGDSYPHLDFTTSTDKHNKFSVFFAELSKYKLQAVQRRRAEKVLETEKKCKALALKNNFQQLGLKIILGKVERWKAVLNVFYSYITKAENQAHLLHHIAIAQEVEADILSQMRQWQQGHDLIMDERQTNFNSLLTFLRSLNNSKVISATAATSSPKNNIITSTSIGWAPSTAASSTNKASSAKGTSGIVNSATYSGPVFLAPDPPKALLFDHEEEQQREAVAVAIALPSTTVEEGQPLLAIAGPPTDSPEERQQIEIHQTHGSPMASIDGDSQSSLFRNLVDPAQLDTPLYPDDQGSVVDDDHNHDQLHPLTAESLQMVTSALQGSEQQQQRRKSAVSFVDEGQPEPPTTKGTKEQEIASHYEGSPFFQRHEGSGTNPMIVNGKMQVATQIIVSAKPTKPKTISQLHLRNCPPRMVPEQTLDPTKDPFQKISPHLQYYHTGNNVANYHSQDNLPPLMKNNYDIPKPPPRFLQATACSQVRKRTPPFKAVTLPVHIRM